MTAFSATPTDRRQVPVALRPPHLAASPNDRRAALVFLQYGLLPILFVTVIVALALRDHTGASVLTGLLIAMSVWFVRHDARAFGGVTFASCFVAVSCFVFAARAIYVIANNDYSIILRLGLPVPVGINHFVDALAWVVSGLGCFIFGALFNEQRAAHAAWHRSVQGFLPRGRDLTLVFLLLQVAAAAALAPLGLSGRRIALTNTSDNAYIYLLPTLVHGFNLYAYVYVARRVRERPSEIGIFLLLVSFAIVLVDAFFLYNMSNFRGFYTVGVFTVVLATFLIFRGKISVWLLVALFAIYPFFKTLGSDRSLSNEQVIEEVILKPGDSYTKEGMDRAFGYASDINMLDTLIASLNWRHRWRPYFFSYVYPLVHWVPRKVWPGKPRGGVLADVSYTYGIPYSPGIIGFINDDGGKLYMLLVMGLLGWFMRLWQLWTERLRTYELRIVTWSAFFLTALVTVRYLPYQSFYGFMIFFVPALVYNAMVYFGSSRRLPGRSLSRSVPA